jgi:hypothetical protein
MDELLPLLGEPYHRDGDHVLRDARGRSLSLPLPLLRSAVADGVSAGRVLWKVHSVDDH